VKGFPCRGSATASGYCPVHTPSLAPAVAEGRRKGGYNKAHTRRMRWLLEESGLAPVFEGALRLLARLEGGEVSPQVAVAASHLLRVAVEVLQVAHKLSSKEEGAPPQALPPVTAVTQDEERWARIMARATQLYEEATAPGAPLGLSEKEERQAQLIAEATKILQEHWPRKPEGAGRGFYPPPVPPPPAEMKTTMETPPSRPFAGGRLIVHSHPRWDEEEGASPRGFSA
jgi:hypothetical protein